MRVIPGTRLGVYEVIAAIGEGGMGQVFRARDTKLDRDIALKILPEAFAHDADRMARFTREAKTLASLNHPHIASIYGLEEQSGTSALVMELVEGEDLSQRIARGPLPFDEAVPIARQIAEALEAAHEQGIVHRDLKPANIKVRSDGTVKVLDFGLAKAMETAGAAGGPGEAGREQLSMSPTMRSPTLVSGIGVILGTAAYMAPEQAKGKSVDKRADIWAFGVVLYEMLTARHPFTAETIPETLANVMTRPIDLGTLPAGTPTRVRDLLARCLEKDPKKRLRDIGEARIRLEEVVNGTAEPQNATTTVAAPRRRSVVPWLAATVTGLALAALAFVHFREAPVTLPLISSSLNAPDDTVDFGFSATLGTPELSPDGQWIVFGARMADNKAPLWIRSLAAGTARVLPGTDGANFPFWSPDSRYVGFFAGGKLKKIDVAGGPPIVLADAPTGRGGSWSPEGVIVFAPNASGALSKVSASGGTVTPATSVEGSSSHRFPWFLPDGRHFLVEDLPTRGVIEVGLRIGSLDSQQTMEIRRASSNAIYSSGYLLFLRDATLMAQPFDPNQRTVLGEAVPATDHVSWVLNNGRKGVFTMSTSGLMAYRADASSHQKLSWFDRTGRVVGTLSESGDFPGLELSPDRKSAAVITVDAGGNQDIWIHDLARNLPTRFTFNPDQDRQPIWSPDGRTLVWLTIGAKRTLYRKSADGNGTAEVVYEDTTLSDVSSWSPDGKFLLVDRSVTAGDVSMWILPIAPEQPGVPLKPTALVDTPFAEGRGVFSPDGHWVAFISNQSQQNEIYVVPFPGPGGKRQISTAGGVNPRWRHDGKEIFYNAPDGKLMAAEVTLKDSSIDVGQVKPIGITMPINRGMPYDVSLDGQRILAITEDQHAIPLTLVQNWTALLKK